jgi:tetraacyldisaccharide 4'-kinase
VVVVGNIFVGGTGKTPFVIFLVNWLRARGMHPGVVSRGYGSGTSETLSSVSSNSLASEVGDEPLLIHSKTHCPVVVCRDRLQAAHSLVTHHACDVIVTDDGLQHYRLQRNVEIAITDTQRGLGNGWLLPAGPLREKPERLDSVDWAVWHGKRDESGMAQPEDRFWLELTQCRSLHTDDQRVEIKAFAGKTVHAVAGIGHPYRFFESLEAAGIDVIAHPFPDHHAFVQEDIDFGDTLPILVTEKDAVKLTPLFAYYQQGETSRNEKGVSRVWAVETHLQAEPPFYEKLARIFDAKVFNLSSLHNK